MLFVYRRGHEIAYLLLCIGDIISAACTIDLLLRLTDQLHIEFAIKDLGPLDYFHDIEVVRCVDRFFLHQGKYAHELLDCAGMLNCKPATTPSDTKAKLSSTIGLLTPDAPFYRTIVGVL